MKYLSRTTTIVSLAVLLCCGALHGEEQPTTQAAVPNLSGQHLRTQAAFKKHAKNWVRIGDVLWSIEVKNFSKRKLKGSAKARAPYEADNVPMYYDPVAGKAFKQAPIPRKSLPRTTAPKIPGGFYVDARKKLQARKATKSKAVHEGEHVEKPVTEEELFVYFIQHDLHEFPVLRPKRIVTKTEKINGWGIRKTTTSITFDWKNYPEKVRITK